MQTTEKEKFEKQIIVKGIRIEDHPTVGPKLGIIDRKGIWYNTLKRQWANIPDAWETMTKIVSGERAKITYTIRAYTAKDGSKKSTNDIVGFEKIIQKEDEVKPVPAAESLSGETLIPKPSNQEMSPKQTCVKSATDLVVARIGAGESFEDVVIVVMEEAKRMFAVLREAW